MTATNIILVVGAIAGAALFLNPRLVARPMWRATITPLASIIGSGFLIAAPILSHATGTGAWIAMAGLCAVAWCFGAAVRHNIQYVEPLLDGAPPRVVAALERAADLMLSVGYLLSVAYFLNLFAAFALRIAGVTDPMAIRAIASVVILLLGFLGVSGGLRALERVEILAVGIKLSLISALLLALAAATGVAVSDGSFAWPQIAHIEGFEQVRTIFGVFILVQGFETSRYLGASYNAAMRVRSMRWAQMISAAIYLAFTLLVTAYFTGKLSPEGGETAILDILAPIGSALAPLVILVALASQMSAAVAVTNGEAGLLAELSRGKISINRGNLLVAAAALLLTWTSDIYQIISYVSRAFVLYYAIQCLQAALSAKRLGKRHMAAAFLFLALAALLIALLAKSAGV